MKIIQCSIFQRNTVLLEITQNKQNLAQLSFYFPLTNKLLNKNISKTNESTPLKYSFHEFHIYLSSNCFLNE